MKKIRLSGNSRFVRLFVWWWEANPEQLNICKLFWGTLFFPIALCNFESAYRFVPRIAVFYAIGAPVFMLMGMWFAGFSWLIVAALFAALGYAESRQHQNAATRREAKSRRLAKAAEFGSRFGDKLGDTVVPVLARVFESRLFARADGFFAMIGGYMRALKARTCPQVEII